MCIHAVSGGNDQAWRLAGRSSPPAVRHDHHNPKAATAAFSPPAMAATSSLLAGRPDFPSDLRILLLEPDAAARQATAALLSDLAYRLVTPAASPAEAAALLRPAGGDSDWSCMGAAAAAAPFDIVLADAVAAVGDGGEADGEASGGAASTALRAALSAAGAPPLVLMGAGCSAAQVMAGLRLGAQDVLERPLSPLKLTNLWQHTVRRELRRPAAAASAPAAPPPPLPSLPPVKTRPEPAAADGPFTPPAAAVAGPAPGDLLLARRISEEEAGERPWSPWGAFALGCGFDDFDADHLELGSSDDDHQTAAAAAPAGGVHDSSTEAEMRLIVKRAAPHRAASAAGAGAMRPPALRLDRSASLNGGFLF